MATAINFNSFDTPAIRDVLKCKAHLLRAGIPPDYAAVETLTIIIDHYRRRVGLKTYLSEMLGPIATTPIEECELYWVSGDQVELHGTHGQPVQQYIARSFSDNSLDKLFRVVAGNQERYL